MCVNDNCRWKNVERWEDKIKMILGKIVIEGPDNNANNEIADAIFAHFKSKNQPAIFIDNYKENDRDFIIGETFIVAVKRVEEI